MTGTGEQPFGDELFDTPILDSAVVFHGRVWDVRRDVVRYGEGEIVRDYVDHTGAAAVVAVDDEDRVLLIQQYRHPIRRRDWEIPAGLLDIAGESPRETARRELAEEVDLAAGRLDPLVSLFTSPGGSDEIVHVFLARDLVELTPHEREDEEADIRVEWVPIAEAVDAVLSGRVRNGILIAGVLAAAERLRRDAAGD
jgi:8-oxo-dGDP phosphatase